jgi:hypothetical protein
MLPDSLDRPAHWPNTALDPAAFYTEWRLYKSNPAAYVPPQDRPDPDHS